MSYDIQIKFKDNIVDPKSVEEYINRLPNTENCRYYDLPDYYMEIDMDYVPDNQDEHINGAEKNCISFHVPYAFMNKQSVDHDVYFNYINTIADHFGGRAYDLQKDIFLDIPEYQKVKRRMLTPTLNFWNVIEETGGVVRFSNDFKDCRAFQMDLSNFTMRYEDSITIAAPIAYQDYHQFKAYRSNDSELVAVTNRKEKIVKLFPGTQYNDEPTTLEVLWNSACDKTLNKCGDVVSVSFTADDKKLLTGAYRHNMLKLWDINNQKLICNFICYARCINKYLVLNDRLICVCSKSVISFFNYTNGDIIISIVPLDNNWLVFNPNGDYEFGTDINGAIELDWIDNDKNETFSFIPQLGFAYYERCGSFKLNKLKETSGTRQTGLLKTMLEPYL